MRRRSKLPELLAPAGSMEALYAAVMAGADAVYVGGKRFGARAYAKNFDISELKSAVEYCHLHGVRLYVTVNTLLSESEVMEAVEFARELYVIGVDALIVCDVGLITEIRRAGINIELHGSTQMSVHNSSGADRAHALGITRVVLARELSYDNIKATTEKCIPETEVFLHGALCVSHSGQCLFSSLVGGRSGNRGECAQPCRLPYNNKYPLSLTDLSLAKHIPILIESGAASLKIEGRMKSPSYVFTVTEIYRRLLDERRAATREEEKRLAEAFSRGGFTDGYFRARLDGMTGVRSESDKEASREAGEITPTPIPVPVKAECKILRGSDAVLTLTSFDGKRSVTVTAPPPSEAISAPLDEESVKARLVKMGGSYLSLKSGDITLALDSGLNMSPGVINGMRRVAVEKFCFTGREALKANSSAPRPVFKTGRNYRSCLFFSAEKYRAVSEKEELKFFDRIFIPLFDFISEPPSANGVYIPPVITEGEWDKVREALCLAKENGAIYALFGNIGALSLVKEAGLIPVGDFRLNITNPYSRAYFEGEGVESVILSPELTSQGHRRVGGGAVVYGRIPLMLTERCFIKENFGCDRCSKTAFVDRLGAKFPIIREWEHRNLVLNSVLTYMGDKRGGLYASGVTSEHFLFTIESDGEILSAIRAYSEGIAIPGLKARRMGKREATHTQKSKSAHKNKLFIKNKKGKR